MGLWVYDKQTLNDVKSVWLVFTNQQDMFPFGKKPVFEELVYSDRPGSKFLSDID